MCTRQWTKVSISSLSLPSFKSHSHHHHHHLHITVSDNIIIIVCGSSWSSSSSHKMPRIITHTGCLGTTISLLGTGCLGTPPWHRRPRNTTGHRMFRNTIGYRMSRNTIRHSMPKNTTRLYVCATQVYAFFFRCIGTPNFSTNINRADPLSITSPLLLSLLVQGTIVLTLKYSHFLHL